MPRIDIQAARTCADLKRAVAVASPFDEILIHGPIDIAESVELDKPLTLSGATPRAALQGRGMLRGKGRGLLVVRSDVTIRNVAFRSASAPSGNGAGVWHDLGELTLERCIFSDNQNGLLAGRGTAATVRASMCTFVGNGAGCGHTHGIYINEIASVWLSQCSFERTVVGHHIKSRAAQTRIEGCIIRDTPDGSASYGVDVSNGGAAWITGNLFVKGRQAMSRHFIAYCPEQSKYSENSLAVCSNIFIGHKRGPMCAVVNRLRAVHVDMTGNAFEGMIIPLLGRGRNSGSADARHAIAAGPAAAPPAASPHART